MVFLPLLIFGFGLIVGSFLNVVILRLNTGRSALHGRSKCPRCNTTLSWYELIPVFSFLFQKGKCRSCNTTISFQYPLIELLTGLLFTFLYTKIVITGDFSTIAWITFIFTSILAALLVIITVYDLRHKIIPDKIVYPFIILSFASIVWKTATVPGFFVYPYLLAGFLLAAPFFFLWFFSKGRLMGFGDIKLALGIGWLVGLMGAFTVFLLSFWMGAIVGVFLIALSKSYGMKSEIPFAPFLLAALFLVGVCGVSMSTLFPLWP